MWRQGRPSSPGQSRRGQDPRRRTQRHKTESLACDIGTVVDLSTAGMRVACSGKPPLDVGQIRKIKLRIPEGSLPVTGRVVWMRRTGFRKYQMGIEFQNVKRSISAALDSLARFGFLGMGSAYTESNESEPKNKPHLHVMVDLPDYYALLNITAEATPEQIRDAFRSLARKYHPDVSKDPHAEERFIQVHEAYEVLRDPERRKSYDMKKAG